jgi:hypothetical protein
MRTSQASMLASLTNVQRFFDEHAAKLPDVANGAARRKLDDVLKGAFNARRRSNRKRFHSPGSTTMKLR